MQQLYASPLVMLAITYSAAVYRVTVRASGRVARWFFDSWIFHVIRLVVDYYTSRRASQVDVSDHCSAIERLSRRGFQGHFTDIHIANMIRDFKMSEPSTQEASARWHLSAAP